MQHVGRVQVLEGAKQIVQNQLHMLFRELAGQPELQQLAQVALLVLHHYENIFEVALVLAHRHHQVQQLRCKAANPVLSRLVEASHDLDFADDLDAVVLVLGKVLDELNGNCALGHLALALDDHAEASLAQVLDDLVVLQNVEPDRFEA